MSKTVFLLIFLVSCASVPQVNETIKFTSPKIYNADCFINNERHSESNLLLLEESKDKFKVRAGDGKILGLPQNQCILSQIQQEEEFPKETPKQKWVQCKLGNMSLVTDSLVYLEDKKHFYKLKRKDGQVWMLPREHCAIWNFTP